MSSTDRAKKREQRRNRRQSPSAPRAIGANDNHAREVEAEVRAAKDAAKKVAISEAQDHYKRLIATGVDAQIAGALVTGKRIGGLEWLLRKQRIDLGQYRAGDQYGVDFAIAEEPTLRSCLNDRIGGEPEPMQETRRAARDRLEAAREVALQGHEGLIRLMDAVCGHGARVRVLVNGDDSEASKKEAELVLGLDFLRRYYGMI